MDKKGSQSLLHPLQSFSRPHLLIFAIVFGLVGIIVWKSLAATNPNLPSDLNGDNTVSITDLSILLSDFNSYNSAADINSDGSVNIIDLSLLLSYYGQTYNNQTCTTKHTASNAQSKKDPCHHGNGPKTPGS